MDNPVTHRDLAAFRELMESENARISEENKRQNHRIEILEDSMKEISKMSANTERLAVNMENMLKVQELQGSRLKTLEARDGEMWRKVAGYLLTAVVGIVIGFVFKQIGM